MGFYTANSIKRDIWINTKSANGDMITINREYLSYLLDKLENSQHQMGYDNGYEHGLSVARDELPSDNDFEGKRLDW